MEENQKARSLLREEEGKAKKIDGSRKEERAITEREKSKKDKKPSVVHMIPQDPKSGEREIGANSPTITVPVTYPAASPNNQTVASAISLTVPSLPSGILFAAACRSSFLASRSNPSVPLMPPGAMTLEVMPRGPNSRATLAERASTPALATATCVWSGAPV